MMNTQKEMQHLKKLTAILEMIEYAEIRLRNFEEFRERVGMFLVTRKMVRNNEFTRMAKKRLERYYFNTKNEHNAIYSNKRTDFRVRKLGKS